MNFVFYWKKMESSKPIEEYAEKRFSKWEKYLHQSATIHVSFEVEKKDKIVHVDFHADGHHFSGSARDENINSAIDDLDRKIATQLRRYHQKLTGKH